MSRAIKVEEPVYNDLDNLRAKGETFSQVIEGLLDGRLKVFQLLNVLSLQAKLFFQVGLHPFMVSLFFCLVKAAKAYDRIAIDQYGEFAKTNFLKD